MDKVNLAITGVALSVTAVTSYLMHKRLAGARSERVRNARREVVSILTGEFVNSDSEIQTSVVEALLSNKYRDCKVESSTVTELPLIIDDLIAGFTENIFITHKEQQKLVKRALALKQKFESRKSNLEEAIDNWRQSSIPLIAYRLALVLGAGICSGLIVIFLGSIFAPTIMNNLVQLLGILGFATVIFSFAEYNTLKSRRERNSRYLQKALEDTVAKALRTSVRKAVLEQHARVDANGHLAEADLILSVNENKVPVEIKYSSIRQQTIEQIANTMEMMNSKNGLLITTSAVGKRIKELARQKGIIVLENVTSEADIVKGLENTKLFE